MSSNGEEMDNNNEDDICQRVKLKKPIYVSDLYEDGGTFEAEQQPMEESPGLSGLKYDFDDNILQKLQCGIYGKEIVDDEYNSSEEELEPFEKLSLNMEDITGDGGVKKRIIEHGYGDVVAPGSFVIFKYNGYQEYNDEPFDSSTFQDKPTKIHLGKGQLIAGLEAAVSTMKKKEVSHFIIEPIYAYGEIGCPPRIPAKCTLFFEVTLHDWVDSAAADAFSHYDDVQQTTASFDERYKAALAYKNKGNDNYKHENYSSAKRNYKMGSWIMESARLENAEQEELNQKLLFTLYTNCAMASLNLDDPRGACVQCQCAMKLNKYGDDEKVAQLFYRFGKAKFLLKDYKQALKYSHKAFKLRPTDSMIKELICEIEGESKKAENDEKILYRTMLGYNKADIELSEQLRRMALVDEEFKKTVKSQIEKMSDESMKNSFISLRSNLTIEELEYAKIVAQKASCSVELITRGSDKHYRIYSQL